MKEAQGTFEELAYLWESLNPYCRWCLVEEAYGMKKNCEEGLTFREDMPSEEEALKIRAAEDEERERRKNDPSLYSFEIAASK